VTAADAARRRNVQMPRLSEETHQAEARPWADQRRQDAAALFQRFGAECVAWLDRFLADYVFEGEPLDQVVSAARRLGKPPVVRKSKTLNDH